MSKIFSIGNIPEELLPEVGGKARGLAKLIGFGYVVPDAFIITDINPADDMADVLKAYSAMGQGSVSVRSSATLEDGDDFSAAGQFSTYLDVNGPDDLLKAVRECAESINNETAHKYSTDFLQGKTGKMTVIVQRMIYPRAAGVIFTHAPMKSGWVLVEAVEGLGENLVSGKKPAQQYRVKGKKIDGNYSDPFLSNSEAVTLATEGLKAERHFGMPLDLEWAIDSYGKIWWLQARPITVGESVTVNELDCNLEASQFVYTTGNIGEMMPGAVTPLNLSTNMYALDWGVKETYARIGCCTRDIPAYSFIASYYNHMFFNMTNMYSACHSLYGSTKETLDISICGHELEGFPDSDMADLPPFQRFRNTIPFMKLVFSGSAAKKGMNKVVESLSFDLDADIKGLYSQIIEKFDALKWAQFYHYCASYYSGGQSNLLLNATAGKFPSRNDLQALVAGSLTQIDDFESASILRSMTALAALMTKDCPEVKGYDIAQLKSYMESAPSEVRESYEAFMKRHGHRGIREPEIMSQPWRDNPESFFTSLKSVLSSGSNTSERVEKPWTEYKEEILSHFSGLSRKMVAGMIDRARKGVCYREYTKSRTILVLDKFRQAYRQLARLMVKEGLLPEEDCIFFLLQDEVGKLIEGDRSLIKRAVARKRLFPIQQKMKFPYCQMGIPSPLAVSSANPDAIKLQGTPVSRGIATGKARIVRSEEDASRLQAGEIMIAESTDIGWTPFYSLVSGMVTEIGSALSHGIVVAREYALPAVVNVDNALQLIKDGDTITIDGNSGTVTIDR